MKIKNSKEQYCTRAVIGGAKSSVLSRNQQSSSRESFEIDSAGYFLWEEHQRNDKRK